MGAQELHYRSFGQIFVRASAASLAVLAGLVFRWSCLQRFFSVKAMEGFSWKNSMTMFMSEVLYRTLREGEGGGALFDWCRHSILTLNALESDFSNYHLRFLLELTGQLGFSAGLEDLAPFAGEYYGVLKELLQRDFASSLLLPLSGEQRSSVAALLLDYIGYHIESQLEIRSLGVLRELFR